MKNINAIVFLIGAAVCVVRCDDGNPNDIVQICDSKKDLDCLRDYFGRNSECNVIEESIENPIYEQNLPIYIPSLNTTVVVTKNYLSQLHGEIEEAYLDKESGNVVISVNFKGLHIYAPNTIFAIGQDGLEPKVLTEFVICTYPTILTAVFSTKEGRITKEALKNAHYSAFFENTKADIIFGPKIIASKDPVIQHVLAGLLADVGTALQEIFRTKASYYFLAYMQNNICDYDLPPVLNEYDLTVLETGNNIDTADESQFTDLCGNSDDVLNCARDYFEEKGTGSVIRDPTDEPVYREKYHSYVPWLNLTCITTDANITNLDGTIKKMYINKKTGNLVMNIAFKGIVLDSSMTIVVDQRGRQPKHVTDSLRIIFPVKLTVVIPMDEGITKEALQLAYVSDYYPEPETNLIELGPNYTESEDPQIQTIVKMAKNNPIKVEQEVFVTEAYQMFIAFLQKYVSNYGIPLGESS